MAAIADRFVSEKTDRGRLTKVSPSIRSVFARRRRREVRIEAASTTWLSIPSDCSTRWIQKPSRPASWMTIIGKSRPVRARAFSLS